uniref:Uncharacterized protein n=1 Tax=Micrurus carvalhoi TaxID=3147026 RepID=A0A2H6N7Z7_9SAUR
MKGCHGSSVEAFGVRFIYLFKHLDPVIRISTMGVWGRRHTDDKRSGAGESSVRRRQQKQRRNLRHFKGESICYDIGLHQLKLALKIPEVPSRVVLRSLFPLFCVHYPIDLKFTKIQEMY